MDAVDGGVLQAAGGGSKIAPFPQGVDSPVAEESSVLSAAVPEEEPPGQRLNAVLLYCVNQLPQAEAAHGGDHGVGYILRGVA